MRVVSCQANILEQLSFVISANYMSFHNRPSCALPNKGDVPINSTAVYQRPHRGPPTPT